MRRDQESQLHVQLFSGLFKYVLVSVHVQSPVESTRSDHQLTASVRSLQRVLDDIRTRCVTMETNLSKNNLLKMH